VSEKPGPSCTSLHDSLINALSAFHCALHLASKTCSILHVELTAIKFNRSTSAGPEEANAISLRQNFATAVTVPEWTKGKRLPKDSPAAYAIAAVASKIVAIEASFATDPAGPVAVDIRAEGGGVLGPIDPTTIKLSGGTSVPDFVPLNLPHHRIGASGILREDIQWDWFYKATDGTWVSMGSSFHRIYVVLDAPSLPWLQPPTPPASETQLPWVEALDRACLWAGGTLNVLDAATAVTKAVNSNLGLTYDVSHGASKYTQAIGRTSWFLCTAFLAFLNRQPEGKGNIVNCTDCATVVSSFANLLGCRLAAAVMASPGGFLCNKIIAIGGSAWNYPFPPANRFAYHEVAWTGAFSHDDRIFDACLLADNSSDPWNWTDPALSHMPLLPLNEIFTSQGEVANLPISTPFTAASYRERLAQNSAAGIGRCVAQGPRPNAQGGRRGVV
jgi:hypothetical protein